MKFRIVLLSLPLLCFSLLNLAQAAIEVYEFDNSEQEQLFKELSSTLRCPKCQNNTIADSNSALAQDLRQKVYQMIKQQKSSDEIVDYMVARYGQFITYKPAMTTSTAILWFAPGLVILFGFGFILARSRKNAKVAKETWNEGDESRLAELLEQTEQHDKSEQEKHS